MNKVLSSFLDRLAERFAALMAGLLSSRVESLHAVAQAEQQSQLEDLARTYESEGKTEIAAALRSRAGRLNSTNLASEAVELMQQLADPPRPAALERADGTSDLPALPNFDGAKPTRRRRMPEANDAAFPSPEAQS